MFVARFLSTGLRPWLENSRASGTCYGPFRCPTPVPEKLVTPRPPANRPRAAGRHPGRASLPWLDRRRLDVASRRFHTINHGCTGHKARHRARRAPSPLILNAPRRRSFPGIPGDAAATASRPDALAPTALRQTRGGRAWTLRSLMGERLLRRLSSASGGSRGDPSRLRSHLGQS